MDKELLREYRCKVCHKLLCKGFLSNSESALEVKCRGCGSVSLFYGEDAEIISKRAALIKQGIIKDVDEL